MHGSGGISKNDLMYWDTGLARRGNKSRKTGMTPPEYLADQILVVPVIESTLKKKTHKMPPPTDFFQIIQYLYEYGDKRIYAVGTSRGSMWLSHALQERPSAFLAVLLTGCYGNSDWGSSVENNELVMGSALHKTTVPVISCMSSIDVSCGSVAQPIYWSCFKTREGIIDRPGSLLEVEFLDTWSHDELSCFFYCEDLKDEAKAVVVRGIWERFLVMGSRNCDID